MKILITGATGLIGKELSKLLLEKGHTIHYLTTSKSKIKDNLNNCGFYWNPNTEEIDSNCLTGVEIIIHLAGASISKRWTNSYKKEIIESRVLTSNLLLKTLNSTPNSVKQFISASGTAIYPESFDEIFDETTTQKENSFLSDVVQIWEKSADLFKSNTCKVCKLRTGVVFAKDGGALPEMVKPIKLGFGSIMGNGKQIQSWIHINDLTNMYLFAIDKQLEGVFNAVSPNPVSNAVLTKAIANQFNKTIWLPNVPKFIMNLLLGEMAYLLFSSKNLNSNKMIKLGFQFQFPNLKEALQDIYK
jgi:uncharacterized protein (TIGR01777 family)